MHPVFKQGLTAHFYNQNTYHGMLLTNLVNHHLSPFAGPWEIPDKVQFEKCLIVDLISYMGRERVRERERERKENYRDRENENEKLTWFRMENFWHSELNFIFQVAEKKSFEIK